MNAQKNQKIRKFNSKLSGWILIALNALSFVFLLIYEIVHHESASANVFAVIFVLTALMNLAYAAGTRNRWGFWLIWGYALGMVFIYGMNYLVSLNLFTNSVSVVSSILILLYPVAAAALQLCDLLGLTTKAPRKSYRIAQIATVVLTSVLLIVFTIFSHDAVNNFGYAANEYTTTRAEFVLWFSIFAILMMSLRIFVTDSGLSIRSALKKSWAYLFIVFALGGYGLFHFWSAQLSVFDDITAADKSFAQAFGEEALRTQDGMRNIAYCLPDLWTGIRTGGFTLTKDVLFYQQEGGLSLRCDVYASDDPDAHRSVLVTVHGRGNDKGNISVPHRNKYFASQGYVVFDLQVGDFKEKNTGAENLSDEMFNTANMLINIDRFFEYAVPNDVYNCNWNSVFLSGYSMGGAMVNAYSYGYDNRMQEFGATLKGVIPCYSGYSDSLVVNETSAPCLAMMGTNDGAVNRNIIYEMEKSFAKAGVPYAGLWFTSTGHGCDIYMYSRANQTFVYYMERFMAHYR